MSNLDNTYARRAYVNTIAAGLQGELDTLKTSVATLNSKLSVALTDSETFGYIGVDDLDQMKTIIQKASVALNLIEETQNSVMNVLGNFQVQLNVANNGITTDISDSKSRLDAVEASLDTATNQLQAVQTAVYDLLRRVDSVVFEGATTLGGLDDVSLSAPGSGEVLKYDGSNWVNAADASGTSIDTLEDIGNVIITSVGDNEVLAYDSGSAKWINQTPAEAGLSASGHTHTASNITDFNTSADARVTYEALNANGDVGTGSAQVSVGNHSHALDNLSNVTVPSPSNGDLLYWNGSAWTDTSGITISTGEAPINIPILTADPVSPSDGDLWVFSSGAAWYLRVQIAGVTKSAALS